MRYRKTLPQVSSTLFLTDGGIETSLNFLDKLDLPCFAAFLCLMTGRDARGSRLISVRTLRSRLRGASGSY